MMLLTILGYCPNRIISKAKHLIRSFQDGHARYKKLSGLRQYSSIRLNNNYRLLLAPSGSVFIGSHEEYERKIKQLKKTGGQ